MNDIDTPTAQGPGFQFTDGAGRVHSLPSVTAAKENLTGRDMRDALLGGEMGQIGYLIRALEKASPDPAALDALYDLPQADMLSVLSNWADYGDGDGATLGESSSSSPQ